MTNHKLQITNSSRTGNHSETVMEKAATKMADEQKKGEQQQKKAKPGKGEQKGRAPVEEKAGPEAPRHAAKERARLRARFEKEVSVALMKELELKNPMAVPRLNKIVVNMGVGEGGVNADVFIEFLKR